MKLRGGIKMIDMIIPFLFFAWVMFIITNTFQDRFAVYIVSVLLVVLGIFVFVYGIGTTNNWLTRGLGLIHFGLGLITIFMAGFEYYQRSKEDSWD